MKLFTQWTARLRELAQHNPVFPWVVAFLLLNVIVTQYGGTNAKSRYAALRAITEKHTLNIDPYKGWTHDWSRSPNGHYYSNKAPGSVLLALPLFALTDGLAAITTKERDENGLRPEPGYIQHLLLVLFLQMLPISFLVLWLGKRLSTPAAHFFALATLFGNTAAFYYNSLFGHSLAAILFLLCFLMFEQKKFFWAGLCYGFTLLSDYGAATALPAALVLLWQRRRAPKTDLLQFAKGGLLPGVLWVWYHTAAFGSPLTAASAFINPDVGAASYYFPRGEYLRALLIGPERGILFTQPWVYAGLLGLLTKKPRDALFILLSLTGALWLSAATDSWHGGFSAGPRYLAFLFPTFAAIFALRWTALSLGTRTLLWIGVAAAALLRAIMYPFSNLAPLTNLWTEHVNRLLHPESGTPLVRLFIFITLFFTAAFFVWKKHRALRQDRP